MKLLFNELTKIPKMLRKVRFGIRPEERKALRFKRKKILSWKKFIINRKDIKNKFTMKIQILTSINSWLNQNKKEEFIKSLNKFSKKINYVNKIANLKKNYDVFLTTDFEGGRHERRVNKINK